MAIISSKPVRVALALPHAAFPVADWGDCYETLVSNPDLTAIEAARLSLGYFPRWVRALMTIRDTVVGMFGLKSSQHHSPEEMDMIGIFPVISQSTDQVVLGFDDRHLDFRAVISVRDDPRGKIVSAATLVKRKILLGKLYLAVITPFHRLIVSAMLANMNKPPVS